MIGEHSLSRVRCFCELNIFATRRGAPPNSGVVSERYALELRRLVGGHTPHHDSPLPSPRLLVDRKRLSKPSRITERPVFESLKITCSAHYSFMGGKSLA
jgi:hypothetical protein